MTQPTIPSALFIGGLVLAAATAAGPTATAGQASLTIDLSKYTTAQSEYALLVGAVTKKGEPSTNRAVCLQELRPGKRGLEPVGPPELVAFIAGTRKSIEAIASASGWCQGIQCTSLDIIVSDHNVVLDSYPQDQVCVDPAGIAAPFGFSKVALDDLPLAMAAEVRIDVRNRYDLSAMTLVSATLGLRQTCTVPPDDTDVRYGAGWYESIWTTASHVKSDTLFVCSEGVRVCTFSRDYMEWPLNRAVIRGNDRSNTLIMAAEGMTGYYGGHECRLATDAGFGRYRVDGWQESWKALMQIEGHGGNDWILGSPNVDFLFGGDGDDLLRGMGGSANRIYGENGHDLMHDAVVGTCDGGLPEIDVECSAEPWEWPAPYDAGDCCCSGCGGTRNCITGDMTPGVNEVPPTPW